MEAPRTAEDEAFIDDEGADPAEDVFGDEEEVEGDMGDMLEAAEDDDEIDRMLNKKKQRRHEQSLQDIQATVESFLARMEAAAEGDMDANTKNKPAIQKLRMLPDVQDILSNQNVHNEFLDGGLLGVFKAWIEPMPDGSLPNITVRSAVLKLLAQLPIDISYEGRKEQLKKSGLGKVVMFLFKLPDETAANRFAVLLPAWPCTLSPQQGCTHFNYCHFCVLQQIQMQELAHIQGPATPSMLVTMFTLAHPLACGSSFAAFWVDHMCGKSNSTCGFCSASQNSLFAWQQSSQQVFG